MRDTSSYRAIPFRDSIAEGSIARVFALFSCGIAQVSLRYPFVGGEGGVIAPPFRMLSKGKRSEKGEGVSPPIGHVETPKAP